MLPLKVLLITKRGTVSVTIIVGENGISDPCSNPRQGCLCFTLS